VAKSGKAADNKAAKTKAAPASHEEPEVVEEGMASRAELAGVNQRAREAEQQARNAQARATAARKAAEKERELYEVKRHADENIRNRKDRDKATVMVVVQTKRERYIKLREGMVPSRTPVKVSRRQLRRLQGMARKGNIQLIVGELEKPGELLPRDVQRKRPAKVAGAKSKEG
jgi:hypothetical protein